MSRQENINIGKYYIGKFSAVAHVHRHVKTTVGLDVVWSTCFHRSPIQSVICAHCSHYICTVTQLTR